MPSCDSYPSFGRKRQSRNPRLAGRPPAKTTGKKPSRATIIPPESSADDTRLLPPIADDFSSGSALKAKQPGRRVCSGLRSAKRYERGRRPRRNRDVTEASRHVPTRTSPLLTPTNMYLPPAGAGKM